MHRIVLAHKMSNHVRQVRTIVLYPVFFSFENVLFLANIHASRISEVGVPISPGKAKVGISVHEKRRV